MSPVASWKANKTFGEQTRLRAYKFLIFQAKIFYSSELRAAAPLIAIIFMSKYKLNFFGFTRDCRFDVTHTHTPQKYTREGDGWDAKGAWQGKGSWVGGGHIVTSCGCQSSWHSLLLFNRSVASFRTSRHYTKKKVFFLNHKTFVA